MKKTIILSVALVCVALGTSISVNLTMKENLSTIALANLEALTYTEQDLQDENCDTMDGQTCYVYVIEGVGGTKDEITASEGYIFDNMTPKLN